MEEGCFFPNSLGKPKAYRQAVGVQLGVLTGVMREWLNQTGMLSFCESDGYYRIYHLSINTYVEIDILYQSISKAEGFCSGFGSEDVRLVCRCRAAHLAQSKFCRRTKAFILLPQRSAFVCQVSTGASSSIILIWASGSSNLRFTLVQNRPLKLTTSLPFQLICFHQCETQWSLHS